MLKKRAFNRIFFSTIAFFIVFVLYNLKVVNSNDNNIENINDQSTETIYTLNNDNYVSKTDVYVGKFYTLQDRIKEKLEIMTEENDKNALLPSYFKPILPKNTKVLDVVVEDSLVKVYFSKELNNITEEQSEKMIEAIIYTITNENILGIEIYVDGQILKYVPHTKEELPAVLTKDFGINKTYEIFNQTDIAKVVMTYYADCFNSLCEVPVTKYINDDKEKIEIIFNELENVSNNNLISLLEDTKLLSYKIGKDSIIIDINKDINKEERNLIFSSIFSNYDVKRIKLLINGQKKYEKNKKDIEK